MNQTAPIASSKRGALFFMANVRGDSWFHHLDPRVKLIWLVVFILVDLIFLDPLYLFIVFLTTIPVWLTSKVDIRALLPAIIAILLPMIGLFLFIFSTSGAVATTTLDIPGLEGIPIGPFVFYPALLANGLVHLFRMAIPISASLLVFATTDPADFARAINRWKVPREISFLIVMSLRLFPITIEEFANIRQAQKVRGASSRGPINRIRALSRTGLPLLIILLRKSRQMGIAIEARGFGARKWEGALREWRITRNDYLFLAWVVVFFLTALYVRYVLGLGWGTLVI